MRWVITRILARSCAFYSSHMSRPTVRLRLSSAATFSPTRFLSRRVFDQNFISVSLVRVLSVLRAAISLAMLLIAAFASTHAGAVDAINVRLDAAAIDLTDAIERQKTEGDRIQVSTAPGADGIVRRIEVRAREGGNNWAVFALANNGDGQVDRLSSRRIPEVGSGRSADSHLPHLTIREHMHRPDRHGQRGRHISASRGPGTASHSCWSLRPISAAALSVDRLLQTMHIVTLNHGIVIGISVLLALFPTISSW